MSDFKDYLRQTGHDVFSENRRDDPKIVHLYHHLPTIRDVALASGKSLSEIYRALKRNEVRPYRRKKPTYEAVWYYFKTGLPLDEIARLTDYSVRNVRNIINDRLKPI